MYQSVRVCWHYDVNGVLDKCQHNVGSFERFILEHRIAECSDSDGGHRNAGFPHCVHQCVIADDGLLRGSGIFRHEHNDRQRFAVRQTRALMSTSERQHAKSHSTSHIGNERLAGQPSACSNR